MNVAPGDIELLLPDFLVRQRWFAGDDASGATIREIEVVEDGSPTLLWLLVDAAGATYQVFVGLRPLEGGDRFLEGKGQWLLGDLDSVAGPLLAYDALVDPDLSLRILELVAPEEAAGATHARPIGGEESNTSVVFDERVIVKVFRRVEVGPNPDVELPEALTDAGFPHVAPSMGEWRRGGRDLAVARAFLGGGGDGWHLALGSLRDLLSSGAEPADAGGDLGPEAERLGRVTAELHLALAAAQGSQAVTGEELAEELRAMLPTVPEVSAEELSPALDAFDALARIADAGRVLRVHGDLHLGQVLRTDMGWFVLDFEGEPAVPLAVRRRPSSPMRDIAGMLRSFHYASAVAIREQGERADDNLRDLAARWEAHAAGAFLAGYGDVAGVAALLPENEADRSTVLDAHIAAKAAYEVAYERAHRPDWVDIPLLALERLSVARR